MPIVNSSPINPPWYQVNRHLQTILPAIARIVTGVDYTRERINTPDGDFLDLDWSSVESDKLAILCHGLEGSSDRPYMKGMARALNESGWDALAWNYRGCSEEMNRALRFYHSGETTDLDWVIQYASRMSQYKMISLIGFSLGGNMTLKYLGEKGSRSGIHRAVTFSVPLDLYKSCLQISKRSNYVYSRRFLRKLKAKVYQKARLQPLLNLNTRILPAIKTIYEFDDLFTAPMHGFEGAMDYYERCSSIHFLSRIQTPTLIVNARNDPFLPAECYPFDQVAHLSRIYFESPAQGGHCGFAGSNGSHRYWSEKRADEFLNRKKLD